MLDSASRLATVAPWDKGPPVLHGPAVYGASARKPFLYSVPVTGEPPLRFEAEALPEGLRLDPATGQIRGAACCEGEFPVLVHVENRQGKAEKELVIAVGCGLALTPPMGWNSWNGWRRWVDDGKVRAAADGLVRTGLAARGYTYINIDSCWQGPRGGRHDAIQPNRKFPDMHSLGKYIHDRGLKFGIYSSPWTVPWGCFEKTAVADWGGPGLIGCSSGPPDDNYTPVSIRTGQYVGVEKHEPEDVAQWLEWEVDFLKYDWRPTDPRSLERMGRLLKESERDIVLSICTEARLEHVEAYKTWAHMWRGIPDTFDTWPSILKNAFMAGDYHGEDWRSHIGPGNWHDLDMLALGPQFQTATNTCPNRLTSDEQITHMTAWALYPSPLILSCNLNDVSDFELRLFGNEEVIAVNQDRLGKAAIRFREDRLQSPDENRPWRNMRIWARPLSENRIAVGLFNLADVPDELSIELKTLGLSGSVAVRNLWERRDLGRVRDKFSIPVPAHGAQLITLAP